MRILATIFAICAWTIPLLSDETPAPEAPTYLICVFTPTNSQVRKLIHLETCKSEMVDGVKTAKVSGYISPGTTIEVEEGPKFEVKDREFSFLQPLPERKYVVHAKATNQDGTEGDFLVTLVVKKKLMKVTPEPEEDKTLTSDISRSFIQIEGASYISFSSLHDNYALAATGTLRSRHWFGYRTGMELAAKGRIWYYNDLGSKLNPTLGEARLNYRWHPGPLLNWSFVRANQLHVFLGVEAFQNKNTTELYKENWTLAKFGVGTRIGIAELWDTGGEASYSIGSGEFMIELQGDVNYAIGENTSLGLGYRAHMYNGKSPRASDPSTTVFREAYGELYGSLRYLY